MGHLEKAQLLLDIAKLRLRTLNGELEALFDKSKLPRKIDVERIRQFLRRVYRDLTLVSSVLPREATLGASLVAAERSEAVPPVLIPRRSEDPQQCFPDCTTYSPSLDNSKTNLCPSPRSGNMQRVPDPLNNYIKSLTNDQRLSASRNHWC
jgi:hypothetical protein